MGSLQVAVIGLVVVPVPVRFSFFSPGVASAMTAVPASSPWTEHRCMGRPGSLR